MEWYTVNKIPCVDLTRSGIYRWVIEGAMPDGSDGIYIGKYSRIRRPTKEYRRNVARIQKGLESHHKSGKFRRVHHALADAIRDGRRITLTILANANRGDDLNQCEQAFIRSERANLNGRIGPASAFLAPSQLPPLARCQTAPYPSSTGRTRGFRGRAQCPAHGDRARALILSCPSIPP
jgi:hypothetical protein